MSAASWDFLLCSGTGEPLAELTTASGKQLKFQRNTFAEAEFVLSHQDAAAGSLLEAVKNGPLPTLRAYRKSPGQTNGTLRFNGYLAPFTEQLEETGLLTAMFRSPFGRLYGYGSSGTGRYTNASIYTEEQYADNIAADLIRLYGGAQTGGVESPYFPEQFYNETSYAGLGIGTLAQTVQRTITYQYTNVGQAIMALSECIDGFDFGETFVEETAAEPTLALFNTYASQGEVQPLALFQYGPSTLSNVASVSRTTGSPCNYVRLIGPNGLVAVKENAASIAKYGKWQYQEQATTATAEDVLNARAEAMLREGPIKTLAIGPDLGMPNCPLPWDNFWIGDTIFFHGRRGAFEEDLEVRVNEITVVVDENGFETATIPDPYSASDEAPDLLHTVIGVQA